MGLKIDNLTFLQTAKKQKKHQDRQGSLETGVDLTIGGLQIPKPFWIIHGLSMDNCAITRSIKVPYLPSDKTNTRSTLNSKIDKVPWRKVAATFLGPATVIQSAPTIDFDCFLKAICGATLLPSGGSLAPALYQDRQNPYN